MYEFIKYFSNRFYNKIFFPSGNEILDTTPHIKSLAFYTSQIVSKSE